MIITNLDKSKHDRKHFDCGVGALNNYLSLIANQQHNKDNVRTYVLEDEKNPNFIVGYYTLTMISIDLARLPDSLQKKHQNANIGGLIARLAVDKNYIKQGFGSLLLVDALLRVLKASEIVGFPLVVVDAKDGVEEFYEKFGFIPFADSPNKLFMTVASIRKNLT